MMTPTLPYLSFLKTFQQNSCLGPGINDGTYEGSRGKATQTCDLLDGARTDELILRRSRLVFFFNLTAQMGASGAAAKKTVQRDRYNLGTA